MGWLDFLLRRGHGAIDSRISSDEMRERLRAIEESTATIEFEPDGTIIHANQIFLDAMGYRLEQIVGQRHSMFCTAALASSAEYARFWRDLAEGKSQSGVFERVRNGGAQIWIEGQYNALRDRDGNVRKVVKYASDVTDRKLGEVAAVETRAQIEAISSSMAFIEFEPEGIIRTANTIFLEAMGYELDEIVGQHHRIFVESGYGASADYQRFWDDLRQGRNHAGEFERRQKNGETIWIEGRYNSLRDEAGKVFRVVKYASNVTDRKLAQQTAAEVNQELLASAEQLRATSEGMIRQAQGTSATTARSLARVEEVSELTGRVADVSQEMSMGLADVAQMTKELSERMDQVVHGAKETSNLMAGLRSANDEISRVSDSISQIADQTNLLALNATIEAASAGDAGRGFAVVASEVKDLANETMKATDGIRAQVSNVQAQSTNVANALERINDIIAEVSKLTRGVSDGMAEQDRITSEISASMAETAEGARSIKEDISGVSAETEAASGTFEGLLETSKQLLRLARQVSG